MTELRTWNYGLTADEWLHLASEGPDSEVAPCCGDIGQLREYLQALTTSQGKGSSVILGKGLLEAYATALASHDTLSDEQWFPLLHKALAGLRGELAIEEKWTTEYRARMRERAGHQEAPDG
jgi:hypothetical protein